MILILFLSGDQIAVAAGLKQYQQHTKKPAIAGFFVGRGYHAASRASTESEACSALETLKRVRQRASDVFLYATATGRAENNPVTGLHKALKTASVTHRLALRSTFH